MAGYPPGPLYELPAFEAYRPYGGLPVAGEWDREVLLFETCAYDIDRELAGRIGAALRAAHEEAMR